MHILAGHVVSKRFSRSFVYFMPSTMFSAVSFLSIDDHICLDKLSSKTFWYSHVCGPFCHSVLCLVLCLCTIAVHHSQQPSCFFMCLFKDINCLEADTRRILYVKEWTAPSEPVLRDGSARRCSETWKLGYWVRLEYVMCLFNCHHVKGFIYTADDTDVAFFCFSCVGLTKFDLFSGLALGGL